MGLRIADCGFISLFNCVLAIEIESLINPQSAIRNPQSAIRNPQSHSPSVNLRLRRLGPRMQKIEVATLIGLCDVSAEEGAEAALVTRRRRRPSGAPARHLFFADQQIQFSLRHVQLDQVSVSPVSQRTS